MSLPLHAPWRQQATDRDGSGEQVTPSCDHSFAAVRSRPAIGMRSSLPVPHALVSVDHFDDVVVCLGRLAARCLHDIVSRPYSRVRPEARRWHSRGLGRWQRCECHGRARDSTNRSGCRECDCGYHRRARRRAVDARLGRLSSAATLRCRACLQRDTSLRTWTRSPSDAFARTASGPGRGWNGIDSPGATLTE